MITLLRTSAWSPATAMPEEVLPVMVLLEDEVQELADAHVYLDPDNPIADTAVDLLLGTQGWRRFALVHLQQFLAEHGDDTVRPAAQARQLCEAARGGQISDDDTAAERLYLIDRACRAVASGSPWEAFMLIESKQEPAAEGRGREQEALVAAEGATDHVGDDQADKADDAGRQHDIWEWEAPSGHWEQTILF